MHSHTDCVIKTIKRDRLRLDVPSAPYAIWGFLTAAGIVLALTPLVVWLAPRIGGVDDKGRSFTPLEPHLTDADRAQARDPDPAAVLRLGPLKGLGLDRSAAFVESVGRCRAQIAEKGALATLAGLEAG